MLCKYCGKEIIEGSKFCSFCGKDINNEENISQTTDTSESINRDSNNSFIVNANPKRKKTITSIVVCIAIILFGVVGYVWNNGSLYSDEKKTELIIQSYIKNGESEALKLVNKFYPNDKYAQDSWVSFFVLQELDESGKNTSNINSSTYEQIKKDNNINLDAKDVQYDMVNNLDKSFALHGTAELDDYYNYGFDDDMEADYFCIRVRPIGGSYSDEWYIYLHRSSFKELYDKLKVDKKEVILQCKIPKYRYEKNMNNMAICESAWW